MQQGFRIPGEGRKRGMDGGGGGSDLFEIHDIAGNM